MRIPIVHQNSYGALIVHTIILAGLVVGMLWKGEVHAELFWILFIYLALFFTLRGMVAPWQAKGMCLIRGESYDEAIECFQRSYDYFERHPWVDKFRFITLLSCSRVCYREMALCNIAFCYGQLGEGEKAVLYYQKTLEQFPDSMIAKTSLNLLNSLLEKARKQGDCSGTV